MAERRIIVSDTAAVFLAFGLVAVLIGVSTLPFGFFVIGIGLPLLVVSIALWRQRTRGQERRNTVGGDGGGGDGSSGDRGSSFTPGGGSFGGGGASGGWGDGGGGDGGGGD
ncbi:hypothetical protein [Thermaurantiacus sp.]